ncbi:DgyrCDS13203 [Dimorphilus gyrociliatus]|uniref:DgyrCDS13203 n=1 Tax=Dimorphilus gyrociliatus TaxID=2664684 RepID=A0A7I8W9Z2_9ANNE|nr:DgyrCDS13203 [Dimorphilus gyrociliatus]
MKERKRSAEQESPKKNGMHKKKKKSSENVEELSSGIKNVFNYYDERNKKAAHISWYKGEQAALNFLPKNFNYGEMSEKQKTALYKDYFRKILPSNISFSHDQVIAVKNCLSAPEKNSNRKLTKNLIDSKQSELVEIFKQFKVAGNDNQRQQDKLQERLKYKIEKLEKSRNTSESVKEKRKVKRLQGKKNKQKKTIVKESVIRSKKEEVLEKIKPKPIFNKEGNLVFSKFDFVTSKADAEKKKSTGNKDYKKLLKRVEKNKQKLQKLKETDSVKAKTVEEKEKWRKVMDKAKGVKVKDDEKLLKKSLKRKEKKKDKSGKEWKKRKDAEKQKLDQRIKKRNENLKKRKEGRIKKKVNKAKKKGRIIPGF